MAESCCRAEIHIALLVPFASEVAKLQPGEELNMGGDQLALQSCFGDPIY